MFTIRFVRPDKDYKSYSVVSYEVAQNQDGCAVIDMSRKLNGQGTFTEYVGGDSPYNVCYISNLDGKTIDVVRYREDI